MAALQKALSVCGYAERTRIAGPTRAAEHASNSTMATAKKSAKKATKKSAAKKSSSSASRKTATKKSALKKQQRSTGEGAACWPGFKRVPGTKAGAKGSCEPKEHQTKTQKKADSRAAAARKREKTGHD